MKNLTEVVRVVMAERETELLRQCVTNAVGMTQALPLDQLDGHQVATWLHGPIDDKLHRYPPEATTGPPLTYH